MAEETVENYIKKILEDIELGLGEKYKVKGDIDFDISVGKTKEVGGGFKIFVADAKGKYSNKQLSRVKIKVIKKRSAPGLSGGKWNFTKVN